MKTRMIVLSLVLLTLTLPGNVVSQDTPAGEQAVALCCEDQPSGNIVRINMAAMPSGQRIIVHHGDFVVWTSDGDDVISFDKKLSETVFGIDAKVIVVKAGKCTWLRVQCFAEKGEYKATSKRFPFKKPMAGPTIVVCKPEDVPCD